MTTPRRAGRSTPEAPAKSTARPTEYEISIRTSAPAPAAPTYQRRGTVLATSAAAAIRAWCDHEAGESFEGGVLRAVPTTNITELEVKVETKRQLTLGAPGA